MRPPARPSPRILDDVLRRGDEAVREYTRRFDGVDLAPEEWELDSAAWQGALDRIAPALRAALAQAVDRVREYHEHQRETGFHAAEARRQPGRDEGDAAGPGRPLRARRQGLLPSSVVMNAVPALVAGVQEIVAVVPPPG